MKTRNFALCALGLAAAISVGSAGTASAQAKSEKRIPVRKDAPAAETPMAKTDTIRLPGRIDTVMVRSRPDTVVRTVEKMHYDTVMQMLPIQKLPGMYFALGGGVAVPMNNWRNSTKDGPAISGQIGYFPKDGMFGIRAEGLANFFSHRQTLCANCPDPRLYEGDVDVMLRFPIERTSKLNPVLYIMGGGGVDKFSNFQPYQTTRDGSVIVVSAGKGTYTGAGSILVGNNASAGNSDWFYNYNVGGGIAFNVMGAHMFVESKYTTINTNGSATNGSNGGGSPSHYFPIIAGFQFY